MTSGVDLLGGLAVLAGMDRLEIAGVTGGSDNDYVAPDRGRACGAGRPRPRRHPRRVAGRGGPRRRRRRQDRGHRGDRSRGDRRAVRCAERCEGDVRMLAMPDHPTPIAIKTHVGEPVPFVLWGPGIAANGAGRYRRG